MIEIENLTDAKISPNDENMSDIRKGTGKVYQILAQVMEQFLDKKSLMYEGELKSLLIVKRNAAEQQVPFFPKYFFNEMADPLLRWHHDRFTDIRDHEITPMFHTLWMYHRKYLGQVQTEEMWEEAIKEGDAILADKGSNLPYLMGFAKAILKDLEWRNPSEGQKSEDMKP